MYRNFGKRLLDFFFSLILIIVLSPILVVVGLLLAISNKGTPFFIHERPGYKGLPIKIVKFKTMNDQKDVNGKLLPDEKRLTSVGKLVRKLSLDELPQFFNVLKGDLSLIGPRPLLFKYLPLYSEDQFRRHEVKPGITGWAQVNGRNSISWTEKFQYDIEYVDHLSLKLDLKIIWLTILKILKSEGVNQTSEKPMEPFTGNN